MDRRSILTVTLLTLCFFGINYYFDMKRVDNTKKQEALAQQNYSTAHSLSNQEIQRRTAPLSAFNLVELFSGETSREFIGFGYQQGNSLLTLQWIDTPPSQVYVGNSTTKPALLISEDAETGSPIVYALDSKQPLTTMTLPQIGVSDVQVVTMNPKPSVYLGQYYDGNIGFPGDAPSENAIVFFSRGGHYYPVGFYDLSSAKYIPLSDVQDLATTLRYISSTSTLAAETEEFYVLENETMQLVISTAGGSLSEINLPLRSKQFPNSIVRPIAIDKTIEEKYPSNALFPEKKYRVITEDGTTSLMPPKDGGYYPLIRRGIYGRLPGQSMDAPVRYNGLNLVTDDPKFSSLMYTVTRFTRDELIMEATYKGQKIRKHYVLPKDTENSPYIFDFYLTFNGMNTPVWLTSGVPEVELISGSFMPALKYTKTQNGKLSTDQIKQPKPSTTIRDAEVQWASNGNGFFGIIIDPQNVSPTSVQAGQIPGEADPSRISVIDAKYNLYPAKDYPGYELLLPLQGTGNETHFRVFAGPFDGNILKKIDTTYTDPSTGIGPGYINTQSFHGWFSFISEPFAKFLLLLMNLFHAVTGSWGLSIILLTVALRVMLFPLNNWSIKSMSKMQEVGPKIERIKEKYKKDQQRMQQEIMKLYKTEGGNPFSGCLPLLIQMPFLIGMFDLLKSSFELRGASFIPGWIDNLAAPDILFSWSYPIPFIGTSFHLLPLFLGGIMYIQQKVSQSRSKRKHQAMTDQQKQSQQMGKVMTLMFTVLFYKSPSGLNLYWISSMGLSALQQWYTMRKLDTNK